MGNLSLLRIKVIMKDLLRNNGKDNLKFIISPDSFFYLKIPCKFKDLTWWDFGKIIFSHKKTLRLVSCYIPTIQDLRQLVEVLENILIENDELPPEFDYDMGLIVEDVMNDKREQTPYIEEEGRRHWTGFFSKIWSRPQRNITWLYMRDKIITLKVTPSYPWTFVLPARYEKNLYSFDEFVRNYKPIAEFTLSHEAAQEWLDQARFLIKMIEENSERIVNELPE